MKGLIFDCDGVLVDSEKTSCGVFGDMLRERGATVKDEDVLKALKGGSMAQSLDYMKSFLGEINVKALEKEYRERSFAAFKENMETVEGIPALLEGSKIPRSVASNGPRAKILLNLTTTGLIKFFDENLIFSAHDFQLFKPNPGIFLKAAFAMNIQPKDCIVIEDSEHGALAAKNAGMVCYGYAADTDPADFLQHGATPFYNMRELQGLLNNQ